MKEEIKKLINLADRYLKEEPEETIKLRNELRGKLQELRDKGYLPKGYAKIINEQLEIKDRNLVYHVVTGRKGKFNYEIAKALIDLAAKPKPERGLIDKADRLLES